jgi:hypothetical protein
MRIKLLLFTLIFFAAERHGYSQNSDLGLLAGVSAPRGEVVSSGSTYVHGSVGASGQIDYAWQILQRAADLYVELPFVISWRGSGTVTSSMINSSNGLDYFFTPGLRLKISPQSRVSFYAAAGGGLASFGTSQATVAQGVTVVSSRTTTAALGFGGGLDFRLTRLLSLRVEGRDFLTRPGLDSTAGRNHAIFQAGIAFHF